MTLRRRLARGAAVAGLGAALAACNPAVTEPTITVEWNDQGTWTAVEDHILVQKQQPDEESRDLELRITAQTRGRINSLRCTRDGVDVPLDIRRTLLDWTAEPVLTLDTPRTDLEIRLMDRNLNEAVRLVRIYYEPDIIDAVYVDGASAEEVHSVWAGDPMRLVVALHQDIVGTYTIGVTAELYNGIDYEPPLDQMQEQACALPDLEFPVTGGRYRYIVSARDPDTGYGEDVTFLAYVHEITWAATGLAAETDAHAVGGSKYLSFAWENLDTSVGEGLWVVEVRSLTIQRSFTTGTGVDVRFDDIGAYRVRVGIKTAAADETYTYSRDLYTPYTGTNSLPYEPAKEPTGAETVVVSTGRTIDFTVLGTDPDGDSLDYVFDGWAPIGLTVSYDPDTRGYEWVNKGTGYFRHTGTTTDEWEFHWEFPAGIFTADDDFDLYFASLDPFSAYSATEITVSFVLLN